MKLSRTIQNEEGASVLFVVVAIPVMIVLVVLIIDIGQMVFARIRLQTTVDAIALAAATRQSTGLNEITDLNNAAAEEFNNAKKNLEGSSWRSVGSAVRSYNSQYKYVKRTIDTTKKRIKSLKRSMRNGSKGKSRRLRKLRQKLSEYSKYRSMMRMVSNQLPWENSRELSKAYKHHNRVLEKIDALRKSANRYFYASAHEYAVNVKDRLMPDATLFSVGLQGRRELMDYRQTFRSTHSKYWAGYCRSTEDCARRIWGGNRASIPSDRSLSCTTLPAKLATTARPYATKRRPPLRYKTFRMKEKWQKTSRPITFAAYGLSQAEKSLILGNDLFDLRKSSIVAKLPITYRRYIRQYLGPIVLPKMTAYAAAKPTGGNVYSLRAEYRPKMEILRRLPITAPVSGGLFEH